MQRYCKLNGPDFLSNKNYRGVKQNSIKKIMITMVCMLLISVIGIFSFVGVFNKSNNKKYIQKTNQPSDNLLLSNYDKRSAISSDSSEQIQIEEAIDSDASKIKPSTGSVLTAPEFRSDESDDNCVMGSGTNKDNGNVSFGNCSNNLLPLTSSEKTINNNHIMQLSDMVDNDGWTTINNKLYYYKNNQLYKGWLKDETTGLQYYLDTVTGENKSTQGIDVSSHQQKINWQEVKNSGIDFAYIRVGYRTYGVGSSSGKIYLDTKFEQNITAAQKSGIKCGVYFYSVAINETEAAQEANFVLDAVKNYKLELPIVFDIENPPEELNRVSKLSNTQRTNNTITFLTVIKNAAKQGMLYTNYNFYFEKLETNRVKTYPLWVAYYTSDVTKLKNINYFYWQNASDGKITGIYDGYGNQARVDINVYKYPEDGIVYYKNTLTYFKNGLPDYTYTGLSNYSGIWYYVKNGIIDYTAETLVFYEGAWYYVKNGIVDFSSTTLCKYYNTWYYVKNGVVDFNAETLCKYYDTWYYVRNGVLDFNAETLFKYYGTWYYVKNGVLDFKAETLFKYYGTWYYVKNGVLDFKAETLCKYYGTWYYVRNGVVDFKAQTLCKYYGTWYYVNKGTINWNFNGYFKYYGVYYRVRNGYVVF